MQEEWYVDVGTVIQVDTGNNYNYGCLATVRYGINGRWHTFYCGSPKLYKVGDWVNIRILKSNPSRAEIV